MCSRGSIAATGWRRAWSRPSARCRSPFRWSSGSRARTWRRAAASSRTAACRLSRPTPSRKPPSAWSLRAMPHDHPARREDARHRPGLHRRQGHLPRQGDDRLRHGRRGRRPVGVVTRSGTLGYEAASQMKALGVGMTTSVGIGGDPINGSSFVDILALFEQDSETEAVMMIGEIGGPQEADAALFVKTQMTKPVIGYVAGLTAPKGRRMGHAGAIISAFGDTAAEKAEIMRSAGLIVAPSPAELGATVVRALRQQPSRPVMVQG